jgi:hypothetical protein
MAGDDGGSLEPFTHSDGALERSGEDSSLELDLLAASLRADTTNLHTFLEVIATKLEDAVPASVAVTRARQGFRGPKLVQAIALQADNQRLELVRNGTAIDALRSKLSGGIVLKRERMDINDWLGALTEMLGNEARRSFQTRQALERLLDT